MHCHLDEGECRDSNVLEKVRVARPRFLLLYRGLLHVVIAKQRCVIFRGELSRRLPDVTVGTEVQVTYWFVCVRRVGGPPPAEITAS